MLCQRAQPEQQPALDRSVATKALPIADSQQRSSTLAKEDSHTSETSCSRNLKTLRTAVSGVGCGTRIKVCSRTKATGAPAPSRGVLCLTLSKLATLSACTTRSACRHDAQSTQTTLVAACAAITGAKNPAATLSADTRATTAMAPVCPCRPWQPGKTG